MAKRMSKAATKGAETTFPMRVAHRIESLLHTMRAIEHHEEQLCVLMTEIKNTGELSEALREELHGLLEELPADAYRLDLEAVSTALLASGGSLVASKSVAVRRSSTGKTTRSGAKAATRSR